MAGFYYLAHTLRPLRKTLRPLRETNKPINQSTNISIKVCGLTRAEDLQQVAKLPVDYVGFIFYDKTKRFVEGKVDPEIVRATKGIKKVGVFVNAEEAYILQKIEEYGLDMLQLHGEESPTFCERLRIQIPVMKTFKIKDKTDIAETEKYAGVCDYFLFDTAGKLYGGTGKLFNWELLKHYKGDTPFFLSGGIGVEETEALKKFEHSSWSAIDVNSKFEDAPGVKNIEKIKQFLWDLNSI